MKASVGVLSKVDASDINLKDSYSKSHRQHLIQTVTPHLINYGERTSAMSGPWKQAPILRNLGGRLFIMNEEK